MDTVERALAPLVTDGTITDEQARAVSGALARAGVAPGGEGGRAEAVATGAGQGRSVTVPEERRLSPLVEAAGYLGAALALAAAAAVAGEVADRLEAWAIAAILGVVGVALAAGGRWILEPDSDAATRRFTGFLWLLSSAAVALGVGTLLARETGLAEGPVLLLTGLVTLALGLALWWQRPGALQLLPVLGGAILAVVGTLLWGFDDTTSELVGVVIWVLGLAWLVLTWGRLLHPTRAAMAIGAAVAALAPQLVVFETPAPGYALGLLTAVGLLAAAVPVRQPVLLGLGAAALALYVPQMLAEAFPGTVTVPVTLLLAGLLLLGGALVAVRSSGRVTRTGHGDGAGADARDEG